MLAIEFPQGLIAINKMLKVGNSYLMNITAEVSNPSLSKVESLVEQIKNKILSPLFTNIIFEQKFINQNAADIKVIIHHDDEEYMYKTSCNLKKIFNIGLQSFV